jgi:hypothetical protein
VSFGGVTHPSAHVAEGAPRRGDGRFGSAGCVGEGTGATDDGSSELAAAGREGVDPAETTLSSKASAWHATSRNAAASRATESTENLRIDVAIP